jgi:transcriptional regulator with XRE-family HTH domain
MGRGKGADASGFWNRYQELTQDKQMDYLIAREAGIRTSTLSSYKTGRRFPRANEAVALAKSLYVSVEWLVLGDKSLIPDTLITDLLILAEKDSLRHVKDLAEAEANQFRFAKEPGV